MYVIAITHVLVTVITPVRADVIMYVLANVQILVPVTATTVHLVALATFIFYVLVNVIIELVLHVLVITMRIVNVMFNMVERAVQARQLVAVTHQQVDAQDTRLMRVQLIEHHNHKLGLVRVIVTILHNFLCKLN